MTTAELSSQFDVLYNNILSNASPGLDEYEKSVLLTKAQDEILKSHLTPYGNKYRQGVDDSAKRQVDFSMLTTVVEYNNANPSHIEFPANVFSALTETVSVIKDGVSKERVIVPISYEEYQRLLAKPYHYPLKRQVWRIITGQNTGKTAPVVQLIFTPEDSGSDVSYLYTIRYIRKPQPIILCDLAEIEEGLTIDGISTQTECEVDPILHTEILQRAIELAKSAYGSDVNGQLQLQNQMTVGQRSE